MQTQQEQQPLQLAINELQKMPKIDIKGKQYAAVSSRVEVFRRYFPLATIETVLVHHDENRVVIQAKILIDNRLVATGYAEELRGDGWINATSALENAETSAVGRALSALGLIGGEYASSFEVENAIAMQQHTQQNNAKSKSYYQTVANTSNNNSVLYQNSTVEKNIAAMGLTLEPLPDGSVSVAGNSYPHAKELRRLGCQWNPGLKRWILPGQQAAA